MQLRTLVLYLVILVLGLSGCQSGIPDQALGLIKAPVRQLSIQPPSDPTVAPTANTLFAQLSPAVAFVETPRGTGSGVLIEHKFLLSNAHVVWPFDTVRVVFPDGSEFSEARVVAWDLVADLALIGPLETDLEPVALVDGGELAIGTDVYLIGYPAEVDKFPQPTITNGILSRVRNWQAIDYDFFQVDATITGGQSGGVLVTHQGDVIGISTFYYGGFGLAGSVAGALPRLNAMLGGDTGVTYDPRPFARGKEAKSFTETLHNAQDVRRYVLMAPVDTEVELTVEGVGKPRFQVQTAWGRFVDSAEADEDAQEATLTFTIEEEAPLVVEVYQPSKNENDFVLTSSYPLIRYPDPDDRRTLTLGESLAAGLDTPDDVDYFELELKQGTVVEVTVDSLSIDPKVSLRYETPILEEDYSDDDSGGGIFGVSAQLIYKAPKDETYVLQVSAGGYDDSVGGYFIHVATADAAAEPTEASISRSFINTFYGRMSWFESRDERFAVLYPADWARGAQCGATAVACYSSAIGSYIVSMESLDELPKKERNRAGYVALLSDVLAANPNIKVESLEQTTTLQGLRADQLIFTAQAGRFKATMLIFVDEEEQLAVSTMFVSETAMHEEYQGLVDLIFDSFRHWPEHDRTASAAYHLDEGSKLAAGGDYQGAINEYTQSIELDADLALAYARRGWAYRHEGDDENALADLTQAIRLEPEDASNHYDRATLHWLLHRYEEAMADLDQAIELAPSQPTFYNQRALINVSLGEFEEALDDIAQYEELSDVELSPAVIDTRGFVYLKMGEFDKAKADYDSIFQKDLRFTAALLGGGIAYAHTGSPEAARKLLEEGLAQIEREEDADPQMSELINMAHQLLAELPQLAKS